MSAEDVVERLLPENIGGLMLLLLNRVKKSSRIRLLLNKQHDDRLLLIVQLLRSCVLGRRARGCLMGSAGSLGLVKGLLRDVHLLRLRLVGGGGGRGRAGSSRNLTAHGLVPGGEGRRADVLDLRRGVKVVDGGLESVLGRNLRGLRGLDVGDERVRLVVLVVVDVSVRGLAAAGGGFHGGCAGRGRGG